MAAMLSVVAEAGTGRLQTVDQKSRFRPCSIHMALTSPVSFQSCLNAALPGPRPFHPGISGALELSHPANALSEHDSRPDYLLGPELQPYARPPVRLEAHLGHPSPDGHLLLAPIRSDLASKGKAVKEQLLIVLLEDWLAVWRLTRPRDLPVEEQRVACLPIPAGRSEVYESQLLHCISLQPSGKHKSCHSHGTAGITP